MVSLRASLCVFVLASSWSHVFAEECQSIEAFKAFRNETKDLLGISTPPIIDCQVTYGARPDELPLICGVTGLPIMVSISVDADRRDDVLMAASLVSPHGPWNAALVTPKFPDLSANPPIAELAFRDTRGSTLCVISKQPSFYATSDEPDGFIGADCYFAKFSTEDGPAVIHSHFSDKGMRFSIWGGRHPSDAFLFADAVSLIGRQIR